VLTQHNDSGRSGANLNETVLNVGNVTLNQFGKLFTRQVDGQIYAQPLYVPSVDFGPKGIHNAVYVATEKNYLYAFDADDPAASAPLWAVNLGTPFPYEETLGTDINEMIGITSTPVIDPVSRTLYAVAKTKEGSSYFYRLHALDIGTGFEKLNGPIVISGSVPGDGIDNAGGIVTFGALRELNRPGLLLYNGYLYIAFGSHNDVNPWHGWVFSYDATTLQRFASFNTTPDSWGGSIWQSGQGLVVDETGSLYFMTANGTFSGNTGGRNMSSSFLKLSTPSLQLQDWFTPYNASSLDTLNEDLASAGPILLPGTNLIVGGGKEGVLYLLNRSNMGHFQANNNNQIVQSFQASAGHIHGSPVYWNSPQAGPLVYIWGENDVLKAYSFSGALFNKIPAFKGTISAPEGMTGAMLSISTSGNTVGTGIVWASMPATGDANLYTTSGVLRAFDASNVGIELWNSLQNQARDDVGQFAKYCPPTIANGRVYLATFSNQLVVYGLNPPPAPTPPSPGSGITFVQVASAVPNNAVNVNVAYPASQTAGNLNVVAVGWNNSTSSVTSVTDSRGNAYLLAVGPTRTTTYSHAIYYSKNIVGGTNTVTVRFDSAPASPDVRVLEYSGLDRTDPLDRTAGATGNSGVPNSGPVSTRFGPELIFAANSVEGLTVAPGQYFTSRRITSPNGNIAEDLIVADAGTYAATALQTTTGGLWVMQTATFKGAGAVAPTAPTVTLVTPSSGTMAGGTPVTIAGTNFAAGAEVTFGQSPASSVTVVNSTTITAVTPAHATGTVPVAVTNIDTQTGGLANGFSYVSPTAPTIDDVAPASGSTLGGTIVAITGTNLVPGATVSFGGVPSAMVNVNGSTSIVATTPPHVAGPVTVTVTNPDAQTVSRFSGFTFVSTAPSVSAVAPNSGLTTGGASVTINGTNFLAGAILSFGGVAASNVIVGSSTSVTATTPPHAAGAVNVTVTNVDGQSGTLTNGFVYGTPSQGISFIQLASATPQTTNATTVAVSFPAAETAGDLNIVAVGANNTTSNVQSVVDNAGNIYNLAIGPTTGTGLRQSIYYASNIKGGATTVTVTFSPAAAYPDVRILEYRGVSVLDVTAAATGSSTTSSSGAATTTSPNELIFGANMVATLTSAAGSGFTKRIITSPDGDIAEDRIVTTAGSYSATASLGSSGSWVMQMATFKPVSNPAPAIASVAPNSGSTVGGTPVTISGANFLIGATVSIGGTPAIGTTVVSPTSITATTPPHAAGAVNVTVTNPDSQTAALTNGFTYVSTAPTITSIAPTSGTTLGGTNVTITGTKFVSASTVTIGGAPATNVVFVDATSITATAPAHAAGPVNVTVTNPDTQSATLTNGFTYVSTAPTIASIAPTSGTTLGGTNVTITGTRFVSAATVTIGGAPATNVVFVDATSITATAPAHAAGPVNVTVTNPDTQSATLTNGFTYVSTAPTIASISPTAGPTLGGTNVTITGTKFVSGATVTLGGALATNVVFVDAASITATTPAHPAGAVSVTVTNPDTQSATVANGFTYRLPPPSIVAVAPSSGTTLGGVAVMLTGSDFVTGAAVSFGGIAATNVQVVDSGSISATSPAHAAGAVIVTVTNPDAQSSTLANGFTYVSTAPTIASVTPNSAPPNGGAAVTITGTNFVSGASVVFGGSAASDVVVAGPATITATVPAHAGGIVTVTVTNPDNQIGTLTNGFTYVLPPPVITAVAPPSGSTIGGVLVTVNGSNFATGATLKFGGVSGTNVVVVDESTITATTPAHAAGPVDVVVANVDAQSNTLVHGFTYVYTGPTVSAVSPASGTTLGGTPIAISGSNFSSGASVTIGGSPAANVIVVDAISITASTPSHATGAASVTVTNPDAQTGTLSSGFNYVFTGPTVSGISPASGTTIGGSVVSITGSNFSAGATVNIGGNFATSVIVNGPTSITATTAAHAAGVVNVTVTNPDSQSATLSGAFSYITTAPTVTAVTPSSGTTLGGTIVTITGTNFVSGAGVTIGGLAATNVVVANAVSLTATTPAHATGAVSVTVTNPDTQSGTRASAFTYVSTAPTLTSVTPTTGPTTGGTSVTIAGTNFVAGAVVRFGALAATGVNVVSGTSITAMSPGSTAGPVAVSVTNPDGQSGTLLNAFTYFVPASVISFVRVAYAAPQSSVTTVSVPYSGAQTAGDLNIVVVGWNDTVADVLSVQDSAGNIYSRAIGATTGTGLRQSIYYAPNIAGGANTVTVTFNRAANHPDIRILEYRGVTTLDVAAGASGRSATPNSGSVTTTAPNELIFGANMVSSITKSAGTGFTSRVITSPDSDIAEDRIVSSIGTYTATANTSTGYWVIQVVTFK